MNAASPEASVLQNLSLEDALRWIDLNTPLTHAALANFAAQGPRRTRMAYAGHIEPKMLSHILAFRAAGIELTVTPCVPGIADERSFAHLRKNGVATRGEEAATWLELERTWDAILDQEPEYLFDIGGGLIRRAVERGVRVRAACEATSTGIDLIRKLQPSFPVFNWNVVPVKNLMHNRYEVGSGVWYAFRNLTGLDLCRLRVGVIGYGLVGQSVASTARGLGANVYVAERDSVRALTAASDGYATASTEDLVRLADVVVSATGVQNTLGADVLKHARDGLILANAGHDSRDINLNACGAPTKVIPNVERFATGTGHLYLLCGGRLLNLAAGGGSAINTFDLVTALIVNVVSYMLESGGDVAPGLHDVPEVVSADLVRAASARTQLHLNSFT